MWPAVEWTNGTTGALPLGMPYRRGWFACRNEGYVHFRVEMHWTMFVRRTSSMKTRRSGLGAGKPFAIADGGTLPHAPDITPVHADRNSVNRGTSAAH